MSELRQRLDLELTTVVLPPYARAADHETGLAA